jgi:hypothetical protein
MSDGDPNQEGAIMTVFLTSIVVAIALAIGAALFLESTLQLRADQALVTSSGARIPDHGSTHNLVGEDWYTSRKH